jgi:hypothetical protein
MSHGILSNCKHYASKQAIYKQQVANECGAEHILCACTAAHVHTCRALACATTCIHLSTSEDCNPDRFKVFKALAILSQAMLYLPCAPRRCPASFTPPGLAACPQLLSFSKRLSCQDLKVPSKCSFPKDRNSSCPIALSTLACSAHTRNSRFGTLACHSQQVELHVQRRLSKISPAARSCTSSTCRCSICASQRSSERIEDEH